MALSYALVATTYPRASIWLALVIAGVLCTFEAVVYAFFTTAMPRSGGDYVFQSRIIGGGNVWTPVTIDTTTDTVFFGTGSPYLANGDPNPAAQGLLLSNATVEERVSSVRSAGDM